MKIENPNKDSNHKPRYKKCGIRYDLGIGTVTKNPKRVTEEELKCYNNIWWLWYEEYWYIIKRPFKMEDLNTKIYSK